MLTVPVMSQPFEKNDLLALFSVNFLQTVYDVVY